MHAVAVLGAGMAGMACARALVQRGCRPVLIGPETAVANRGETLSFRAGASLEALRWHDLLDGETAIRGEGRFSIWGDPALRREDSHGADGDGWHIDRHRLERAMAATLEADGVVRIAGEVRELVRSPDEVRLLLADGASVDAWIVVDCTGRAAVTAGPRAPRRRLDKLVAAYAIVALHDDTDLLAATLVEAAAEGWWYMAPMPGRRMLIGLFTDSDLLPARLHREPQAFAGLARRTDAIAARLESLGLDLAQVPAIQVAAASTVTGSRIVEPSIVRAGDAASALDPLAANGLATALWSGLQAADSVAGLLAGDSGAAGRYEQTYLEGIASQLAMQRRIYAAERRFADAEFWARRAG